MALQKAITEPNGIVTNYHRISNAFVFNGQGLTLKVDSYPAKADKDAHHLPIVSKAYHFDPTKIDLTVNAVKNGYDLIKVLPAFAGSTDV